MAVCPVDAISMLPHGLKGVYPKIDPDKCINCGACDRVCPEPNPRLNSPDGIFAAVSKNADQLSNYASGGVASEISRQFIACGGLVYASVMENSTKVCHKRISQKEDVCLARGSKYVQSDISAVFKSLKPDLSAGHKVLFIGTPCEVAAVKSFAAGYAENLYTIDLICHGVPSQEILNSYVSEELDKKDVCADSTSTLFRWKEKDGKGMKITFGTKILDRATNKIIISKRYPKSTYMAAFFSGISYRENCHKCQFATADRVGDLTIGDFWGLAQSSLDSSKGVSVILVNTTLGRDLIAGYTAGLNLEEQNLATAMAGNKNLNHPTPRPDNKDLFFETVEKYGFRKAVCECVPSFKAENRLSRRIYLRIATALYKLRTKRS